MIISVFFLVAVSLTMATIDLPVRFMTYNVMRGRYRCYEEKLKANDDFRRAIGLQSIDTRVDFVRANLATMAHLMRQYAPDIIAVQEVQESPSSIPNDREVPTASYLAQQLDMTFTFSPTLFDSEVQMQYGTAILLNHSKFVIHSVEILPLPIGLEPRNALCLTVRARQHNVTFRACSVHFDHHEVDSTVRLRQAKTLIDWLNNGPALPTVLLGDFNANQTSSTMRSLYQHFFDDASVDASLPTWSECGQALKDKIDYILLDRQSRWTIERFHHGSHMRKFYASLPLTLLSDHAPLFADTRLRVPAR